MPQEKNPPNAPGNLTGVVLPNPNRVVLSWSDNATNGKQQTLQRCTGANCAGFVTLANLARNTISYTDSTVTAGQTVRYRIRAQNGGGVSAWSNVIEVSVPNYIPVPPSPLPAPASLTVQPLDSAAQPLWQGVAGADSYTLNRGTASGATVPVQTGLTSTTCLDGGLSNNTRYFYTVNAVKSATPGAISAEVSVVPTATSPPPVPFTARYTVSNAGWVHCAHVFAQGQVPSGQGVVFEGVPTQNTVLRTWADGSVRQIILTAKIVATGIYQLVTGTPVTGTFTPTAPTMSVDVTPFGGALKTATFTDTSYTSLWENGPLCKETKQVATFSGATGTLAHCLVHFYLRSYNDGTHQVGIAIDNSVVDANAGEVIGSLVMKIGGAAVYTRTCTITAGTGTAQRSNIDTLTTLFSQSQAGFFANAGATLAGTTCNDYIRATSGASSGRIGKIWKFDNATTARWTGGGEQWVTSESVTFEKISFLIPYGVIGMRRFAVNGFSTAQWTQDFETFYQAGAMFRPVAALASKVFNHTVHYNGANIGDVYNTDVDFEIFNYGIGYKRMSDGGDRWEYGLQPEAYLLWELYQTPGYRTFLFEMADQFGSVSKAAHKSDGTPLTLLDDPNFYYGTAPQVTAAQVSGMFIQHDGAGNGSSHMPDMCFIPYLVTGDRYYAEQVRDGAVYGIMNQTQERRSGMDGSTTEGLLWYGANEKRSITWAIRDLVHYLAYCPDNDANRAWLTTIYTNNVNEEAVLLAREPDTLGYPVMMGKRLYDGVTFSNPAFWGQNEANTFEEAYVCMAFEDARRHGYLIGQIYLSRSAAFFVNAANANSANRPLQMACEYAWFSFHIPPGPYSSYASYAALWSDQIANVWGTPGKGLYTGANGSGVSYAPYGQFVFQVAARLGLSGAASWLAQMQAASPNYVSVDWQQLDEFSYGRQVNAMLLT